MAKNFDQEALEYHRLPKPGKLSVVARKPLDNQYDLSLAYSPGVAAACMEIVRDPAEAATVTVRANLVAVVTNGTAVLGLGDIGPLAAKPVMEGKAVLFKKFAGIDVFDIEIAENDPDKLADIVAALEPTFGGINLEDIKAPECFIVERKLRERMSVPVFHDDQHGTAVIAAAALINGLHVVGKSLGEVKLVCVGAGAAGIACLNLLVKLGIPKDHITLLDSRGVIHTGRTEGMSPQKYDYARDTEARTLDDAITGADIFLGLSAPGLLKPEMVERMARAPLILALANPEPEISPDDAKAVRPDAIIATGRSDYPNQVNNVLCFPYVFRGALDVGATTINEEMKAAAVHAIADLAKAESSDVVAAAYGGEELTFGPNYLIPKPFDPRLIVTVAPAVAKAAMDSGVATRPIEDFEAYVASLTRFVYRTSMLMRPIFEQARKEPKRLVLAEGEDERVLRATQTLIDEGLAFPVLVGRPNVIEQRIETLGLRIEAGRDFELVNPESDTRYGEYWRLYHDLMERKGVSPDAARTIVRTNSTVIAALMVKRGEADAMICGTYGQYDWHLRYVLDVLDLSQDVDGASALSLLHLSKGAFFLCDTHIVPDPSAAEIATSTVLAAREIRRFGVVPRAALLSHSDFGSADTATAQKMRRALRLVNDLDPDLEIEGEMTADAALDQDIRRRAFPNSRLTGQANLLVFPSLDAANTAFNLLKVLGEGIAIGPILMGCAQPAHIVTPAVTARGILNIGALAVVHAQRGGDTA